MLTWSCGPRNLQMKWSCGLAVRGACKKIAPRRLTNCSVSHRLLAGWLAGWLASWLASWLAGWLTGWLACGLAGWLAGCLACWLAGFWLAGWPAGMWQQPIWLVWLAGWLAGWVIVSRRVGGGRRTRCKGGAWGGRPCHSEPAENKCITRVSQRQNYKMTFKGATKNRPEAWGKNVCILRLHAPVRGADHQI